MTALPTPLKDRPAFYWTVICLALTIVSAVLLFVKINQESGKRVHQLQDVICGVYVPIGNAKLPPGTTSLGKTIVVATRHGAIDIHCPGIR